MLAGWREKVVPALRRPVSQTADWEALDDAALDNLQAALPVIFDEFPFAGASNESHTEDDLIWPALRAIGWTASLGQQNLSAAGREDVPDGLLFADDAVKGRAVVRSAFLTPQY